jgi:photosystem II stability/assembly factor-like uncharacterized protein
VSFNNLSQRRLLPFLLALGVLGACDDDPTGSREVFPGFDLTLVPDTLGTQQAIRVVFGTSISAATALDAANFVVTNMCTGLRIPGALRLGGDTLIFTPSQPLPFLIPIGVRIQNLLTPGGTPQPTPIVFQRLTEPPPIRDQTWEFLDSPTNDVLTGVSFVTDELGFIVENGGTVYRTTDGGRSFVQWFKDINLSFPSDIRAFGPDTVYMVGTRRVGTTNQRALFRSLDGGVTFNSLVITTELLNVNSLRRVSGLPEGVVGGNFSAPALFRFFGATQTATRATGTPGAGWTLTGADISPDAALAVAAFRGSVNRETSTASRSLDGGLTYQTLTLPANVYGLYGAGFADNTTAFLLGDSSVVLRFDASATTPTFTLLGAAQGIPQTETNPAIGEIITYRFTRVRFAPGSQTGWLTGTFTRRRTGVPNLEGGVILQSDDGGQTWRRQAIRGALENGLSFPPVSDVNAFREDFAVLIGRNGIVASRKEATDAGLEPCSITSTP